MKVYVLTDDQYEQTVAGVFTSPEAAKAERPNLDWREYGLDDEPPYWHGSDTTNMSRIFTFEMQGEVKTNGGLLSRATARPTDGHVEDFTR